MAEQVNPTGSLTTAIPLAATVVKPQASSGKSPPAKPADVQPDGPEVHNVDASAKSPEIAMSEVNDYLQQSGSDLKFQVDPGSGETYFQVVNSSTGKVVRQVPAEEVLAMARRLREMMDHRDASGVLVDKQG